MQLIKSFRQLSEIPRRDILDRDGNLKRIDKRLSVSIARQIATGFEGINLKKEPSANEVRRARRVIKEFYNAAYGERVKIIRPTKKNRKLYAQYSDLPRNFKVFTMPVIDADDKFIVRKGRVKRIGLFSDSEFFPFVGQKNIVTNPTETCKKTWNKVKRKYKEKKFTARIKCGRHEYAAQYSDPENPVTEIESWISMYGETRVKRFCLGFQIYTFKGQEPMAIRPLEKKGAKRKKKTKYEKMRGK